MPKRPTKKPDKQLALPAPPPPTPPTTIKVLPMQLRVGDRLADETGEWEVIGRPYTAVSGKIAHVRVQRVDQPSATDLRTWSAHERVSVRRPNAEEGKR